MPATRLMPRRVEKVWGRCDLPPPFSAVPPGAPPVGEIWFEDPRGDDAELLVKYLFTSEKLSVQVHPDEHRARARGHRRGKDEAWWVLSAERDARIGLGLLQPLSKEELRDAALDGRIEDLVDWRPVAPGDSFYSAAGTIHAIGAGVALIEVQQNSDVTYRLFDYNRGRGLHLNDAVAAAETTPYKDASGRRELGPGRELVAKGDRFTLERWSSVGAANLDGRRWWIIPLDDGGALDGRMLAAGEVWITEGGAPMAIPDCCSWLVAYPGDEVRQLAVTG